MNIKTKLKRKANTRQELINYTKVNLMRIYESSEYKYDHEFTCEYMKVETRVNINMIMNLHANI